ncbi:hypothetical protein ATM97_32420 [Nocardia sp. MH4]|uniref:hypothetical protein n=1 Tax=unclassified Nocardia TaxID=2637762 RepID=UPI001C4E727A|nr:hypothetical protein [Nocardia sp. MH4]MBW0274023.1 hypothetical protein [Nocardia sp. MH4]
MTGPASTTRILGLLGGVAVILLLTNWSAMRAVAYAVIWSLAAVVLVVRERRRPAAGSTSE